jgi:hypothetical protein
MKILNLLILFAFLFFPSLVQAKWEDFDFNKCRVIEDYSARNKCLKDLSSKLDIAIFGHPSSGNSFFDVQFSDAMHLLGYDWFDDGQYFFLSLKLSYSYHSTRAYRYRFSLNFTRENGTGYTHPASFALNRPTFEWLAPIHRADKLQSHFGIWVRLPLAGSGEEFSEIFRFGGDSRYYEDTPWQIAIKSVSEYVLSKKYFWRPTLAISYDEEKGFESTTGIHGDDTVYENYMQRPVLLWFNQQIEKQTFHGTFGLGLRGTYGLTLGRRIRMGNGPDKVFTEKQVFFSFVDFYWQRLVSQHSLITLNVYKTLKAVIYGEDRLELVYADDMQDAGNIGLQFSWRYQL